MTKPGVVPVQLRIPRRDAGRHGGIALARKGFRPLFLLAGGYAVFVVPAWLIVLTAGTVVPSTFAPIGWHGHEMLFGYTGAVIAGFLLTAAARWTERETAVGPELVGLCALWVLGRIAMWLPLPAWWVAALDLAFLPAVAIAVGRAIVGSRDRRNYGVLGLLVLLSLANALTHLEALGRAPGWGRAGLSSGVALIVLLMLIISGRVIPMFTRNATGLEHIRSLAKLDALAIASSALALSTHLALGPAPLSAALSATAGVLVLARTRHLGTVASLRQPMLWVLHVGHGWIALGLLLRAASSTVPALDASATHALTAGAIGTLTLGMMCRVSLGHTGRPIQASAQTRLSFTAVTVAAALRVCAPLVPGHYMGVLAVSGTLWALAFALFVLEYATILVRPRPDGALE